MADIVGPATVESVKPFIDAVLKGEEQHFERDVPLKNGLTPGEVKQVHVTHIPFRNGQAGSIQGFLAIINDITKLKQSIKRFEAVFQYSPNPILVFNETGILDCNPAAVDILGFSNKTEMLTKHPATFSPQYQPDGRTSKEKSVEMDRLAQVNGRHQFEWIHKKIDGTEFPVDVMLAPIKWNKEVVNLALWNDLTEKRKRDLQLVQTLKMASLGEMASGIAHEINNPLAIIQGKSAILLQNIQNNKFDAETSIKSLEKIISTSERISKIINGLRSFSRNGEHDLFDLVSTKTLFENVLSFCFEKFKTHEIDLRINTIVEIFIECRMTQIEQVILNLLNNAHDAVETLKEKWVSIEFIVLGEKFKIIITDSGNGIPSDVVSKMMQPFFTTKGVGKGTGLGLSISKGIIEDHQGQLSYDASCMNTRFVIELPIKRKPA